MTMIINHLGGRADPADGQEAFEEWQANGDPPSDAL